MNVTQTLQKWGNSAGVRLPRQVLAAAGVGPGQVFAVKVENGSIILTPVLLKQKKTLEELLAGVTPELVGGEMEWSLDVGAERHE